MKLLSFASLALLPALSAFASESPIDLEERTYLTPPGSFKNIITFGDSYSDSTFAFTGARQWPRWVEEYANGTLYPFASAGAVCSNNYTDRGSMFQPLMDYQVPMMAAAASRSGVSRGLPSSLSADTIVTVWIGANDLGVLLTSPNFTVNGTYTVANTAQCAVESVKALYDIGARNFLFMNVATLERTILYGPNGTFYPNFYLTHEHDGMQANLGIQLLIAQHNMLTLQGLGQLSAMLDRAHIAYFDSYRLFFDIFRNPTGYLSGTPELVKPAASCVYPPNVDPMSMKPNCTLVPEEQLDSHFWYDELHFSEAVAKVIAKNVASVMAGKENPYTLWLS
jgi:phospholipase/lecithinase/hemolysin